MGLRIIKGYFKQVYTSAEIMEDCHPELWKRALGQVDRLVELQEKLLDRFKDFQKPMIVAR